jgi:hypothetical protein
MRAETLCGAAALLGLAATAAWGQLALRPGKYDVMLEITLPGSPAASVQKETDCLSAEDAKDLVRAMLRELAAEQTCSASNVKTTGNRLTFDAACAVQGVVISATGDLTIKSDTSYDALMKVGAAGVDTTLKIAGRWVGAECTE